MENDSKIEETENQVEEMLAPFLSPSMGEPENEEKGEEISEDKELESKTETEEISKDEDSKGSEGKKVEEVVDNEVELSEIDEIKKQNTILMQRIEELSGKIISPTAPIKEKISEVVEEEKKPNVYDLIGDNDIDDVLGSKELFNVAIAKAMQVAEERAIQKILVSIPGIVMRQTEQQLAIKQATDEFYIENPDLEPVKKTVAAVANEIYSTNPQLTIAEIFTKSAEKTREILGLRKKANTLINEQGRSPELVQRTTGARGRTKEPSLDKFQQELQDLLNF